MDMLDNPGPARDYPAVVSFPAMPQQPRPLPPALPRRIRKVGAPLGVIIALGTVAGLMVILLTAVNPVGTAIGFVLSSVAMTVVVLRFRTSLHLTILLPRLQLTRQRKQFGRV